MSGAPVPASGAALVGQAYRREYHLPRAVSLYAQERLAVGERAQSLVGSLHRAHTVRAYQVEDAAVRDVEQHSHSG